ncbi:phospholipid phosphatase-related protein type 2 isoform X7 [Canis lupus baileyi]|uniref:phospholipid phosphatase-related protein type 2 isoform X6 n=1 Tax=Canis lupus familiaris TaxID=9615 RepID=UPI000BAA165C|nr:phospholipid phosphatase-related protein type 2 isoform X6 [Canis lupus familiaris]XP_038284480.1 phospholipid phosphatase-related protein type 2 isoform X6 [Canis lupus familiaris]XP_038423148.1 phospholipid phosphatase-related protein type 2 isoform X6 [Canis lupus familiaris]XP_048954450.1 phospholipid phosphatase-related protein type 2 isoform X7 [Canis lupus dingo]|eukprot:XP_022262738.1 phospholipid phosphatase-related protein type 2 isoform X6 [Canis lupus familiaris]
MGVTIPALLAARSGCPAFTMAGGRPQPKRSFSIIPCFVFVESVLLGIVVLLAYRLEFTDTFPVHTQGFFCYDSTYAKPYPGPEAASRVPPALIYALVTAGPTLTILLGELARAFSPAPPSAIPIIGESTIVSGACCRFSPPLRRLVRFLGVYSFGLFTTTIFANAGQVVTGNPTPHFLSVCRPNYTALGCPPPSPDRPGPDRFVTDQGACAGSPSLVAAARRAFPCKDAALCAYAVTYTAMYVTLVFRVKGSRLVKPSLCLALLCPAFLVGVVRVAEYRNHWSDVLAGFLTGAAIATFLVTCVVHNFQSRRPSGRRLSPWEDLGQAPTMDSPLEKLSVAQEPEACRPHSTPARLTPSKFLGWVGMIPVNGGPPMPKHEQRRGGRWGHPLSSNHLSKSESPAGAWGQVPPWQGPWGTPSSLSSSPMCNLSLSPSQLPTYTGLAPVQRFWGSGCCVSPCLCPGCPKPFCY